MTTESFQENGRLLSPGVYRCVYCFIKNPVSGNSVAVQWLGLCWGPDLIPGRGTRIQQAPQSDQKRKKKKEKNPVSFSFVSNYLQ